MFEKSTSYQILRYDGEKRTNLLDRSIKNHTLLSYVKARKQYSMVTTEILKNCLIRLPSNTGMGGAPAWLVGFEVIILSV